MKIGIDIGGSHIGIGLIDENGEILNYKEKYIVKGISDEFHIDITNIKNELEEFIISTVNEYKNNQVIEYIGIAVPGTVNEKKIIKAVNLGLKNYDISSIIEEKTGLKIKLKNDAKCSALAEKKYGNLKEFKNGVYLCIGTGVGGAVIYKGELLEAEEVPGFEFSHVVIQKNGLMCNCGKRGCFEVYASIKRFKEKIKEEFNLEDLENSNIKEFIEKNIEDVKLKYLINQYVENLAIGISNIINIFEPEVIVIGGGFSDYKDILIKPLKKKILSDNMLFNKREDINIKVSKLGNDAGMIGATLI